MTAPGEDLAPTGRVRFTTGVDGVEVAHVEMREVPDTPAYRPERHRRGGGMDPLADYLWAKGER